MSALFAPFVFSCAQAAYEWFSPSYCHAFFTMFPSSYYHENFRSYYQSQKWCPCKRSRSQKSKPNLSFSGRQLQFEFTYDDIMNTAWSDIEEVPNCFSRSFVKFQGHTVKNADFDPNYAFSDCNSSFNSPMATKWCTKLEVASKMRPIVCQGHLSHFNVTRDKKRRFWPKLGVSGLWLQFVFTDGYEIMHKAWSNIEEVPYCFSRSSVTFQGHTGQKIVNFYPNWAFPDCNCSLNSPMALKWCTKLDVV